MEVDEVEEEAVMEEAEVVVDMEVDEVGALVVDVGLQGGELLGYRDNMDHRGDFGFLILGFLYRNKS